MEKAKVYFTDFRCPVGTSALDKLQRLCKAAHMGDIDFQGKFTAIKMHFGELGNLATIRPQYVKAVADLVKEWGGKPFLTDCNTLYPGSRKNALDHLDCAALNGYNTITTGCQVIIGDGLRGTDEVEVPVPNGEYIKTAKIGRAVMDADVFISLAHFKGHEATGFGGAVKNIGMGCGSRAGKWNSILPASPKWMKNCAGAAAAVPKNAAVMPSVTEKTTKPISMRKNVLAAAAASEPADSTPSRASSGMPMNCWTGKWRNTPWQWSMDGPASTSTW